MTAWPAELDRMERAQSGESIVDSFVQQLVASAAQMHPTRDERLLLARVQTKCALGMLIEGGDPKMAMLYLEDAMLHLRAAGRAA